MSSDRPRSGPVATRPAAIVAIPARDEADAIGACIEALAWNAPRFELVVLLNNCTDGTAAVARAAAERFDLHLTLAQLDLSPGAAHAGGARRLAMDLAAGRSEASSGAAPILTTDADSRPAPDWIASNIAALADGADAVAGRVMPDPADFAALPATIRRRLCLERRYRRLLDELEALVDPDPADPWPRHSGHSGASIAISLAMYRRVGGLPPAPVGEDAALFESVRRWGGRIRHDRGVRVTTSCRLDGRASGGMAATLASWLVADERRAVVSLDEPAVALRRYRERARLRGLGLASPVLEVRANRGLPAPGLTFRDMPAAIREMRRLVRLLRAQPSRRRTSSR